MALYVRSKGILKQAKRERLKAVTLMLERPGSESSILTPNSMIIRKSLNSPKHPLSHM